MKKIVSKKIMNDYIDKLKESTSSLELIKEFGNILLESYNYYGKIVIVSGSSDNAGIGYALALALKNKKHDVTILMTSESFSVDGKYYYNLCLDNNIKIIKYEKDFEFTDYDIIVDAIYGIEFEGKMPKEIAALIKKINGAKKFVISVDINSGLNADDGLASICVCSDLTVSIGYYKLGHFLNMAKDNIKQLINVEISSLNIEDTYYLMENDDFKDLLVPRCNYSHKGTYGLVGILGGSLNYSGSIKLANMSLSSLRAGAGLSRIIIPESIASGIIPYLLESTLFLVPDKNGEMIFSREIINKALDKVDALLIGIGWGQNKNNEEILDYILHNFDMPLIIDADGLNTLAKINLDEIKSNRTLILTPHVKEFSRLSGYTVEAILADPVGLAQKFALKYGVIVLLKGPTTVITDGKNVYLVSKGCPGMATAGSGDVLSGILVGLCGYNEANMKTVALGAYINGLAGELAERDNSISMLAEDTAKCVGKAIKKMMK